MLVAKVILQSHTKNIFKLFLRLTLVKRIGDHLNGTVAAEKVNVVGPMAITLTLWSLY